LHGHNVTVRVGIDTLGKFIDFKEVDKELAKVLEPFDHAMVLFEQDALYPILYGYGKDGTDKLRLVALSVEPTTENIAYFIHQELCIPYSNEIRTVKVYETAKYAAVAFDNPKAAIRARYHS
jgi:6-pyruvoyl-tetrahydropterin synthase